MISAFRIGELLWGSEIITNRIDDLKLGKKKKGEKDDNGDKFSSKEISCHIYIYIHEGINLRRFWQL